MFTVRFGIVNRFSRKMSKAGRAEETETVVVLNHTVDILYNVISLYSLKDDSWTELPRFPKSRKTQRGIPNDCQCVSLDGKIYILGGLKEFGRIDGYSDDSEDDTSDDDGSDASEDGSPAKKKKKTTVEDNDDSDEQSSEVHVLDLAGKRKWKKCADMPQPRYSFGCGVVGGKIYVFGGKITSGESTRECLVYDPKEDTWSSIKPMKTTRSDHHVVAVGEELFVHGGSKNGDPFVYKGFNSSRFKTRMGSNLDPLETEVYHVGRDEWRSLKVFGVHKSEVLFSAKGKLYMATPLGIYEHSIDSDGQYAWTLRHSFRLSDDLCGDEDDYEVSDVKAVNDELVALLTWSDARQSDTVFHQSKGFGTEEKKILWDLIGCEIFEDMQFSHFMCVVQL